MDEFLAWLELAEWQNQAKQKQERAAWGVRYGLATVKQCDFFAAKFESAPMPESLLPAYHVAMARRLTLLDYENCLKEADAVLQNHESDPRRQIRQIMQAKTML